MSENSGINRLANLISGIIIAPFAAIALVVCIEFISKQYDDTQTWWNISFKCAFDYCYHNGYKIYPADSKNEYGFEEYILVSPEGIVLEQFFDMTSLKIKAHLHAEEPHKSYLGEGWQEKL